MGDVLGTNRGRSRDVIWSVAAEVRRACGTRWWLLLFPLMGAVTLVAFPLAEVAADQLYYDPQGYEQVVEYQGERAAQRYTSGYSFGQLIAMLFGAGVATAEHRHSSAGPSLTAQPRQGSVFAGKAVAAVLTAVALAAVTGAVAYLLVLPEPILTTRSAAEVLAEYDWYPKEVPPGPLHAGVWRSVQVGLVGFPLWALVGVGLGAIVRRRAVAVGVCFAFYVGSFIAAVGDAAYAPMFSNAYAVHTVFEGRGAVPVSVGTTAALAVILCAIGAICDGRHRAVGSPRRRSHQGPG